MNKAENQEPNMQNHTVKPGPVQRGYDQDI